VPVVEESTKNPNPQGEEKNAAHNPIGLKTETEGQQAAAEEKIQEGNSRSDQDGRRHKRRKGNAA
jgi:hypothetical protein